MKENVYLQYMPDARYPIRSFDPSVDYPEYPYSDCLNNGEFNHAYDMVRECLRMMCLDEEHYGTHEWNPLGAYISPGQVVLIKPNWVMHKNGVEVAGENPFDCLVTHASLLRAVCDYCLIALQGEGEVIVADAPMQDCDLDALLQKGRYNEILSFYQEKGEPVSFKDLRKCRSVFNSNMVITSQIPISENEIDVDLGLFSMHESREGGRHYQVDNYDSDDTDSYQGPGRHVYSINPIALQADVIINFCKPKTHRLAGFTGSMKNMVGIAYDKASLPHRVAGSLCEGGDAYPEKSIIKQFIDEALGRKIKFEKRGKITAATLMRFLYGLMYIFIRRFGRSPYIKGIWKGNDTIWRTVVDLNHIVRYSNKEGVLQESEQRTILNFGDLIVGGEHNGPTSPEPKKVGLFVASDSSVAFDVAICRIMGMDPMEIPLIRSIEKGYAERLLGSSPNVMLVSNIADYSGALDEVKFPEEWAFIPHDNWRN